MKENYDGYGSEWPCFGKYILEHTGVKGLTSTVYSELVLKLKEGPRNCFALKESETDGEHSE